MSSRIDERAKMEWFLVVHNSVEPSSPYFPLIRKLFRPGKRVSRRGRGFIFSESAPSIERTDLSLSWESGSVRRATTSTAV